MSCIMPEIPIPPTPPASIEYAENFARIKRALDEAMRGAVSNQTLGAARAALAEMFFGDPSPQERELIARSRDLWEAYLQAPRHLVRDDDVRRTARGLRRALDSYDALDPDRWEEITRAEDAMHPAEW